MLGTITPGASGAEAVGAEAVGAEEVVVSLAAPDVAKLPDVVESVTRLMASRSCSRTCLGRRPSATARRITEPSRGAVKTSFNPRPSNARRNEAEAASAGPTKIAASAPPAMGTDALAPPAESGGAPEAEPEDAPEGDESRGTSRILKAAKGEAGSVAALGGVSGGAAGAVLVTGGVTADGTAGAVGTTAGFEGAGREG